MTVFYLTASSKWKQVLFSTDFILEERIYSELQHVTTKFCTPFFCVDVWTLGTIVAQSFFMSTSNIKIFHTFSLTTFIPSNIIRILRWRSAGTIRLPFLLVAKLLAAKSLLFPSTISSKLFSATTYETHNLFHYPMYASINTKLVFSLISENF